MLETKIMTGEKDLNIILQSMSPQLVDGEFVFCSFQNAGYGDHSSLVPIGAFSESEVLTLIVPRARADEYGISANVIAGYYHDHIFVQSEHAQQAIDAINELAR